MTDIKQRSIHACPEYGKKKADEIIKRIRHIAEYTKDNGVHSVQITMSLDDMMILASMLYDMDKHLPDFFEEE